MGQCPLDGSQGYKYGFDDLIHKRPAVEVLPGYVSIFETFDPFTILISLFAFMSCA